MQMERMGYTQLLLVLQNIRAKELSFFGWKLSFTSDVPQKNIFPGFKMIVSYLFLNIARILLMQTYLCIKKFSSIIPKREKWEKKGM